MIDWYSVLAEVTARCQGQRCAVLGVPRSLTAPQHAPADFRLQRSGPDVMLGCVKHGRTSSLSQREGGERPYSQLGESPPCAGAGCPNLVALRASPGAFLKKEMKKAVWQLLGRQVEARVCESCADRPLPWREMLFYAG